MYKFIAALPSIYFVTMPVIENGVISLSATDNMNVTVECRAKDGHPPATEHELIVDKVVDGCVFTMPSLNAPKHTHREPLVIGQGGMQMIGHLDAFEAVKGANDLLHKSITVFNVVQSMVSFVEGVKST